MKVSEKKSAAREAAAKHSADLDQATLEYARLVWQSDKPLSEESTNKLQEEMLSLLPPYRHPVRYPFLEEMYFINPDCIQLDAKAFSFPAFYPDLKKIIFDNSILKDVEAYIKESELNKIKLLELRKKISELEGKLAAAKKAYEENRFKRPSVKNAAAVQALGLSTGKRGVVYDRGQLYLDYVKLIRKRGMRRREAVKEVMNDHGLATYEATIKALKDQRRLVLKKWGELHPTMR